MMDFSFISKTTSWDALMRYKAMIRVIENRPSRKGNMIGGVNVSENLMAKESKLQIIRNTISEPI
jgi:hypothetical protein